MEIKMQIRFFTKKHSWLCFRHAVEQSQKGENIQTELENYESDYYLGSTVCELCLEKNS